MQTTIYIEEDQQGDVIEQPIAVIIDAIDIVDNNYGADADGNRGERFVEHEVLDVYIDADDLKRLTEAQAQWAIESAEVIYQQRR